jgi:hypothetical protein
MIQKKYWLWFVLGLLMCAIVAEVVIAEIRGYGFVFAIERTRIKEPKWIASEELGKFTSYLSRYRHTATEQQQKYFPDANTIANNFSSWRLADTQHFRNFNIWVFQSIKNDITFLYKPLPATTELPVNTIVCCTMAKYESPVGVYRPYPKLPKFVMNYFGGEKWFCMRMDLACFDVDSKFPPIPGAILNLEGPSKQTIKYPKSVLSSLKAIYPNAQVSSEQVVE